MSGPRSEIEAARAAMLAEALARGLAYYADAGLAPTAARAEAVEIIARELDARLECWREARRRERGST